MIHTVLLKLAFLLLVYLGFELSLWFLTHLRALCFSHVFPLFPHSLHLNLSKIGSTEGSLRLRGYTTRECHYVIRYRYRCGLLSYCTYFYCRLQLFGSPLRVSLSYVAIVSMSFSCQLSQLTIDRAATQRTCDNCTP